MKNRRFIAVAGNMGVGKSTLVQFLCSQFNGEPFYESVTENPYFEKFFADMKKWSFHSQMFFLVQKFNMQKTLNNKTGLIVLDRTIYEDAEIFATGLYKTNNMSKTEFDLYWQIYQSMIENLRAPDVLIYLTCSLETLTKRIQKRKRKEEDDVPISYLKRLQEDYDKWVAKFKFCDVVTIENDNLDYIADSVHKTKVLSKLEPYLVG